MCMYIYIYTCVYLYIYVCMNRAPRAAVGLLVTAKVHNLPQRNHFVDRLRVGWLNGFLTHHIHRGTSGSARAEDAQGTPTQSPISPSILVYDEKQLLCKAIGQYRG